MKLYVIGLLLVAIVAMTGCAQQADSDTAAVDNSMMEDGNANTMDDGGAMMDDESTEGTDEAMAEGDMMDDSATGDAMMDEGDTMMSDADVTFKLDGSNYKFTMNGTIGPRLYVKEGQKVRIELTSVDGFHDWVIDEFNARTDRVSTGQTASVEFVADQKGTFEYYCSVGSHRANGMYGKLVVE